ncbi:hypothetical protein [Segnochrobactrum spirostomi]|uniref:Uncharacterized protein n=1 Tax=Segnochrobactrum spirostomi TaxID=2608987 RepID=A0A6A7XZ63_9HYPH|nr:hypothetical protein [Segnochrobactrum spirostomi]MQT12090.1 hypothetical protein [Segnochrobactrum spirostomi]
MPDEVRPPLSVEDILSHPRFDAARAAYVRAMLAAHENQPALNRLLIDGGTAFIFFAIIVMQAGFRPDNRATWPTVQNLKRQMEGHGTASARRVHDIVRRLADIGYVVASRAESDKRTALLAPSEKMLAHDRMILAVYFTPLQVMLPEPGYPEPMRHDPAFQQIERKISAAFMGHANGFILANKTAAFFLPRHAGFMILTKLIDLAFREEARSGDAGGPIEVSFADLGLRFGTSRTHVRKLLSEAQAEGLVRLDGPRVALTRACRAGFDRYLADTMAGHDMIYRLAYGIAPFAPAAVSEPAAVMRPVIEPAE